MRLTAQMKPVKKEVLGQDAMAAVEPEMSCSNREAIPDIERIEYKEYGFQGSGESHMHARFMPRVLQLSHEIEPCVRVLDVGCGNGFTCGEFIKFGCQVVGIDLSRQGIEIARKAHPQGRFEVLPADDKLLDNLGEDTVRYRCEHRSRRTSLLATGIRARLFPGPQTRRKVYLHDSLSRLLEEPCVVTGWQVGFAREPALGLRPYQTLEPQDADAPADGNGLCQS